MEKLKVLVVDDEARMRKLVKDFLQRQDYTVIEAENGEHLVYSTSGELLMLGRVEDGILYTIKSFFEV